MQLPLFAATAPSVSGAFPAVFACSVADRAILPLEARRSTDSAAGERPAQTLRGTEAMRILLLPWPR